MRHQEITFLRHTRKPLKLNPVYDGGETLSPDCTDNLHKRHELISDAEKSRIFTGNLGVVGVETNGQYVPRHDSVDFSLRHPVLSVIPHLSST